jgi:fluoroacetyl-CoA thioesterase
VKPSLAPGAKGERKLTVDRARCIAFMGAENAVYATPQMVSDVEYAIRDFLLPHLDAGEDTVGTRVVIDHLAATPAGMEVTIRYEVVAVEGRSVRCVFSVHDSVEQCGRGEHVRFVVDERKTADRIAKKKAQIA